MLIPYVLAVIFPSWKWVIPYSVLSALFFSITLGQGGDGPGAVFGLIIGYGMAYAAGIGVIANIFRIILRSKKYSAKISILPIILFFPISVLIFLMPFMINEYKRRPSEACTNAKFLLAFEDGVTFKIPSSPLFHINMGTFHHTRNFNKSTGFYGFYLNNLCKETNLGSVPIKTTILRIEPPGSYSESANDDLERFCSANKANWVQKICKAKDMRNLDFPYSIYIYSPNSYDPTSKEIKEDISYKEYKISESSKTKNNEYNSEQLTYKIAPNPDWKMPNGDPLTIACSNSGGDCKTIFALSKNTYVKINLRADSNEFEKAWEQYKTVQEILDDLKTSSISQNTPITIQTF